METAPRGRSCLLADNAYPNSHSVFLTSPQRPSQMCFNAARLWKGVGKSLESSRRFMCCMSLRAFQNTYYSLFPSHTGLPVELRIN